MPRASSKKVVSAERSRPTTATPAQPGTADTEPTTAPAAGASGSGAEATADRRPATSAGVRPGDEGGERGAGEEMSREEFLEHQRGLLLAERNTYLEQAEALKAEADSLARDMEPGDIQFDDESGEGGTATIDRERDLVLSAQARAAVDDIDRALAKIAAGTYGLCENCGRPIPQARLHALPYAALCVNCKSGRLSRR